MAAEAIELSSPARPVNRKAASLAQNSIWYSRKWSSTLKSMFDGLVYGLLTAGVFGWLWPGI